MTLEAEQVFILAHNWMKLLDFIPLECSLVFFSPRRRLDIVFDLVLQSDYISFKKFSLCFSVGTICDGIE